MARKSSTSPETWLEIKRRIIRGEKVRALGKEYGIDESTIRRKCKDGHKGAATPEGVPVEKIKELAHKSIEIEAEEAKFKSMMESITTGDRNLVYSYKADLMEVSQQLTLAARTSAQNANLLSRLAQKQFGKIDEEAANGTKEAEANGEFIRMGIGYQASANDASKIPLKLFEIATKQPPPQDNNERKIVFVNAPDE